MKNLLSLWISVGKIRIFSQLIMNLCLTLIILIKNSKFDQKQLFGLLGVLIHRYWRVFFFIPIPMSRLFGEVSTWLTETLYIFALLIGFMSTQRVTWDSPSSLLEKISEYEAVHPLRNWTDLKVSCYFYHVYLLDREVCVSIS